MSKPVKRCHYCGTRDGGFSRDHIVPKARGGQDREWNIVLACKKCNVEKGNKWPTCTCSVCKAAVKRHATRYGLTEQNAGFRAPIGWRRARWH